MFTFLKLGNYGRLGNQLYQIASTIGIAIQNDYDYGFPDWEYQKYFIHPLPKIDPNVRYHPFTERTNGFVYYDFGKRKGLNLSLEGYFQSYLYFDHCKEWIDYYFEPIIDIVETNDISIHVRRGDYLGLQHIHPVYGMEYYNKAMDLFPDDHFDVFSDDIEWCKENFDGDRCTFIEPGLDIMDLFYMSKHKHNIIGNSSFSWWAAYLNKNPDKIVVAPQLYVRNECCTDKRYPKEWKLI